MGIGQWLRFEPHPDLMDNTLIDSPLIDFPEPNNRMDRTANASRVPLNRDALVRYPPQHVRSPA